MLPHRPHIPNPPTTTIRSSRIKIAHTTTITRNH
jgi:hypothetical protein